MAGTGLPAPPNEVAANTADLEIPRRSRKCPGVKNRWRSLENSRSGVALTADHRASRRNSSEMVRFTPLPGSPRVENLSRSCRAARWNPETFDTIAETSHRSSRIGGTIGSLKVGRLLRDLLYGGSPLDPIALGVAVGHPGWLRDHRAAHPASPRDSRRPRDGAAGALARASPMVGQKTEEVLWPVCYRGRGDDPRSCHQDESRSEGSANWCTTRCTIGLADDGSLKSLAFSTR
jgi:hypothetical protein